MRFREAGIGLQSFLEMVLSQRQLALLQEDAAKVDVANRIFWMARALVGSGNLTAACRSIVRTFAPRYRVAQGMRSSRG